MSSTDATASMRRLLTEAGVGAGMRVVDLGCGAGDVTRLIGELVGDTGHVVGVDRNAKAIAKATFEAERLGFSNVTFVEGDLSDALPTPWDYDAAVARRVLMYLPDPGSVLRGLRETLRPGGLAVFQEVDASMTPAATTPLPLHDRVNGWLWKTIAGEGANVRMGLELGPLLERSGFTLEHIQAEAELEGYPSAMATIVRAILPRILQNTEASSADIDVETLEQRLKDERAQTGSVYVRNMSFGVWARKPYGPTVRVQHDG